MKCIILCSGHDHQLYPVTKDRAKALLSIRGKPILEYIVNKVLMLEDIEHMYIVSNARFFAQFKEWVDKFPSAVPITVINDGSMNSKDRLGAMKDLALVLEQKQIDDDVLVIGGDNLFSFSLDEFLTFSKAMKPSNVIGVVDLNGRCKPQRFGIVKLDHNSRVTHFYEKPSKLNGSRLVSACLYFFPKEKIALINQYIQSTQNGASVGNYIQWLAKSDTVSGYTFKGNWLDIGDFDSYTEAVFTF